MSRTITYRVKSPAGEWQRAVIDDTALPQSITGLVGDETYEVDTGKGTLVDVTTGVAFTLEVFTGDLVVNGGGSYTYTITSPAYLAAYDAGAGAGVFNYDTANLATGPIIFYPGSLNASSYNDGNIISLVNPAFGVGSQVPTITYRVVSDTPSPGTVLFEGEVLAYDLTGRAGQEISVLPILTDDIGATVGSAIATFTVGAVAPDIAELAAAQVSANTTLDALSFPDSSAITPEAGANRVSYLFVHFRTRAAGLGTLTATWGASNFEFLGASPTTGTTRTTTAVFRMKETDLPVDAQVIGIDSTAVFGRGFATLVQLANVNQTASDGTLVVADSLSSVPTAEVIVNATAATSLILSAATLYRGSGVVIQPVAESGGTEVYELSVADGTGTIVGGSVKTAPGATGNVTHTYTPADTAVNGILGFEVFKA